ncbi:hypothetical protein [Robertkochia solimangrovi]|uniref:hypothetical protein n=1 Tax=Robertkochia solimangrovi TaxID=2213046 RepID=UPI001F54F063|nr:hypothetical protein [Robertkochia solimangrovi]
MQAKLILTLTHPMQNNFFSKLLNHTASKTVFTILGLIATVITIYAFINDKSVDLRYEIIANTNVLDFNADLGKLRVAYDSTNLKETKENLRIYTIKVTNNGEKNILKEHYDMNDPLGLSINSGRIIEKPEVIQTSSEYLTRNAQIDNYQPNKISFSQVILEPGEYYIIKLLVIHKTNKTPVIFGFGKIAGQKGIKVVNSIDVKEETSFWEKTFYGSIWSQLLRLFTYSTAMTLVLVLIVNIAGKIDEIGERKRRIKMIAEFKKQTSYEYTRMDDAIFERYQKDGAESFKPMLRLISNEEELNHIYMKLVNKLKSNEYSNYKRLNRDTRILIDKDDWTLINEMTNDGVLFKENSKLTINQAMSETLKKFVEFLEEKKEFQLHKSIHFHHTINRTEF